MPEVNSVREWDQIPPVETCELSREYLIDFGGEDTENTKNLTTSNLLRAHELYANAEHALLLDDAEARSEFRRSFTSRKDYNQVIGILRDTRKIDQAWSAFTDKQLEAQQQDEKTTNEWECPMGMLDIPDLLDIAEDVNVETVLIESSNTLAKLQTTPYCSPEAYTLAHRAESLLAPLCEIIGLDGLAIALRSKVARMEMRNTGKDAYVDLAEQLLLDFNGGKQKDAARTQEQLSSSVEAILNEAVGENAHSLVIGNDSNHNVILGDGECNSDNRILRVIWRLKSIGSLARKLAREDVTMASLRDAAIRKILSDERDTIDNASDEQLKEINEALDYSLEIPLDIVGITLVAKDNEELTATYAAIIRRLEIANKKEADKDGARSIETFHAPSREGAYHVEGDASFVEEVKSHLTSTFPDIAEEDMFRVDEEKGFRVVKVTGFYDRDGLPIPFEIQILTAEGRRESRYGKAAHIFYKLSRQVGKRYDPSEEELNRLAQISARKSHFGVNTLCPSSQKDVDVDNDFLDAYEAQQSRRDAVIARLGPAACMQRHNLL